MALSGCGSSSSGFPPVDAGPDTNTALPDAAGSDANDAGAPACTSNTDCPTGQRCDTVAGQCVVQSSACTASSDCASRTDGRDVCDVASGVCVECLAASDCGTGQVCTDHACAASTAIACVNSLDCPTGQVCDTAQQLCVACIDDADCGAGARCVLNTCRALCNSDKDCTPLRQLCDLTAGNCVDCLSDSECAATQYCNQGACVADVCAADTSHCADNAVVTCNSAGSGTLPQTSCTNTQTCVEQASGVSCVDHVCSPLVMGCSATGEQIVACAADGLSQTVTENCATNGEVCVAATCKPVVCQAGTTYCEDFQLRRCSAKGDSYVTVTTCGAGQYCDDTTDSCRSQVCSPTGPACNGSIATTCNTDGSGYVTGGIDCASSGQICSQGSCKNQLCVPSARFCQLNTIQQCSADGLSQSLYQTCSSTQYCNPTGPTCAAQICSPNQAACNGTVATTCNGDGSGYVTGGTNCATTSQACVAGACKDVVCTPSARYCDANTIRQCSADGTSSSLYQTCPSTQYCNPTGPICSAQVCSPNQPACDQNVATTCNATGNGYTGTRTDCAVQGLSCNGGQCVTCPGGNGAIDAVRITELMVGTTDYVSIRNTSTQCTANLAGLEIEMLDSDTTFFSLDYAFTSRTLAPGETVYIFENTSGTLTGDINVGVNIGFSGARGGWVALCRAPCSVSDLAGVVDAVAFNTAPPFPVSSSVSFTSPMTTITSSNQDTYSYQRSAYNGTAPSFVSSDWTYTTPTR